MAPFSREISFLVIETSENEKISTDYLHSVWNYSLVAISRRKEIETLLS